MTLPPSINLSTRSLLAVVLVTLAGVVTTAALASRLISNGYSHDAANDLALLIATPVLLLLWPMVREHAAHFRDAFDIHRLTWQMAVVAVLAGVLMRICFWGWLVAQISFNTIEAPGIHVRGPTFSYTSLHAGELLLALLSTLVLVPIGEEFVHRGIVQSALARYGELTALVIASLFFAILHPSESRVFAFLFGLLAGLMYWRSGILWFPIITHATYDTLVIFDWRSLHGQWNPPLDTLPLWTPGLVGVITIIMAATMTLWLVQPGRIAAMMRQRHEGTRPVHAD